MKNNHKNSQLNDDLQFLINCCKTNPTQENINFIFSYQNAEHLDTNALIGLANQHGILPLVYKTMKSLNHDPLTPNPELLSELKAHYQTIARRNMLMSAELIRIMKLLEKENIEAIAFKGPVLAQMAYGDITLRQYGDLDIFVDEKEILKAGSVLDEHGYDAAFPIKILENKTCLSATNDLGFHNPSCGVLIELHWKLFREKIGKHLGFKQISQNKQTLKINGKPLPTLSSEMLLAYLCLHGAKHAWERIEWICDIDRLIRTEVNLDWDKTIHISKEMDTETTLYLGLTLSHILFRTPLPKNSISITQSEHIQALVSKTFELLNGVLTENEGYSKYNAIHMYQMDLLDTRLKKLNHLFATYFGISRNDCQEFPLPPSLKFLYIFIKPFRVSYKYLRFKK